MSEKNLPPQPVQYLSQSPAGSFKEKVVYSIVGVASAIGLGYFISYLAKKKKAGKTLKKALVYGSPEYTAQQINIAFENKHDIGVDMEGLRNIYTRIKNKDEYDQIKVQYFSLYHKQLAAHLQEYLKPSQKKELDNIIRAKPQKDERVTNDLRYYAWADRLKAAFDDTDSIFPATDEEAIRAVFNEIPTQAAYRAVGKTYKAVYGRDFEADLKSELEFWEYPEYMKIIHSKP